MRNILYVGGSGGIDRADRGRGAETVAAAVIAGADRVRKNSQPLILVGNRGVEGGEGHNPPDLF